STLQPYGAPIEHAGNVLAALTPDGKRLLTATVIGGVKTDKGKIHYQVRLWDVDTGNPIGEPARGSASASGFASKGDVVMKALAWAPDESTFLMAYSDRKQDAQSVQIWDGRTVRPIGEPMPAPGSAYEFSRDGKNLLVFSARGIDVWDVAARKPISSLTTL